MEDAEELGGIVAGVEIAITDSEAWLAVEEGAVGEK